MDGTRFDDLSRAMAAGISRRAAMKGTVAGILAALGLRTVAEAGPQAQCGNVLCATDPGICNPGCVCCLYSNGNSRCRPPSQCTGSGTITCPAGTQFCTITSTCSECCGDLSCDDGIDCTVDVCAGGVCTNTPNDSLCLPSQICDPVLGCTCPVGTKFCPNNQSCAECCTIDDPVCNDGFQCTVDQCILGVCHHTPNDDLCVSTQICDPVQNPVGGCVCPPFQRLVQGECVFGCDVTTCIDPCEDCVEKPDGTGFCFSAGGVANDKPCTRDDECPSELFAGCFRGEEGGPGHCGSFVCNP